MLKLNKFVCSSLDKYGNSPSLINGLGSFDNLCDCDICSHITNKPYLFENININDMDSVATYILLNQFNGADMALSRIIKKYIVGAELSDNIFSLNDDIDYIIEYNEKLAPLLTVRDSIVSMFLENPIFPFINCFLLDEIEKVNIIDNNSFYFYIPFKYSNSEKRELKVYVIDNTITNIRI